MPEPMRVLVEDRRTGRTTQLLRWLTEGEPRDSWPSWSRVIIVRDARAAEYVIKHHDAAPTAGQLLRERGGPALAKVILAYDRDRYAIQRVRVHEVEVAIDDAEEWLHQSFGFVPAVVVLTGARMKLTASETTPYTGSTGVRHVFAAHDEDWHHEGGQRSDCGDPTCPDYDGPLEER